MKGLARGWSVLTVSALLVACAAQQDAKQYDERAQTADAVSPAPPQKTAEARVDEVKGEAAPTRQEPEEFDLSEAVVTGSSARRSAQNAPASINVAAAPRAAGSTGVIQKQCCVQPYMQATNTERYAHTADNPVHLATEQPVSTFSIDVDTGAYANVRRFLNDGRLPPEDAVRVEEMINYFDYQYAPPTNRATPFRVATELSTAPWNSDALLLKIGIKGYEVSADQRPAANLVFLIDVSGSMESPDKLPLLKNAFRMLADQLTARDRVSLVVYAGNSGVVLEPTRGDDKQKIREAIDRLEAGGSTNGAAGIELAYKLAHAAHIDKGINRVVLATDGDFNVGVVNYEALVDMAQRQRGSGVALTTLGFGSGNYNDQLLERLADAGNGNYAYVDSLAEARKVLVSELSSTLFTIAKDVKIQVEFNPAEVQEYRLIGYENRMLAREDFNNDKVDAGEIGAGHRITALYEIVPRGAKGRLDDLRYGTARIARTQHAGQHAGTAELANVRLRYKQPDSDTSQLLEYPIQKRSLVAADKASADLRFAASVAAFGQLLRGGKYSGNFRYADVVALANGALTEDRDGYRREFVSLVKLADSLTPAADRLERVGELAH